MTKHLPYSVMETVTQYMNAEDLAKMAQVSKTWKSFIYRNNVWQYTNWTPRIRYQDHFYDSNNIPSDARHIGMPTELCFLSWANKQLHQSSLPRHLFHEPDPVKFIKGLRKLWQAVQRPCVHIHHHKWHDVFKGRAFLDDLSDSEKQRIAFRILTFPASPDMNAYRLWVETRAIDCAPFAPIRERRTDPDKTDILDIIASKHHAMQVARHRHLSDLRERVIGQYTTSARNLTRISKCEFENNDRAYIKSKIAVFDLIAFPMVSRPTDPHSLLALTDSDATQSVLSHVQPETHLSS